MADVAQRAQRVRQAIEALQNVGYESMGSLFDDVLEFDRFQSLDRCHVFLALLARKEDEVDLIANHDFRQLLIRYFSRIADDSGRFSVILNMCPAFPFPRV